MILRNTVGKQKIKPVRVTILSITQIRIHSFRSIGKHILTCSRIVCIHQMIHLSINSTVGSTVRFGKFQITAGLHFFIYSHLFLGIHNIKVTVAGFHTHGKLSGITDFIDSGFTSLRSHHNYTRHSTCTIYRGSRTIFQYLKTFDIIGIQTGNSGTYQGFGITGGKFVGANLCYIFHYYTIYHP